MRTTPIPRVRPAWLALFALLPACFVGERGSGVAVSQTRSLAPFSALALHGSGEVVVRLGTPAEVVVTTDDNLIERYRTRVVDGVLELGFPSGSFSARIGPKVSLVAPSLEQVEIHGSGSVDASGLELPRLAIEIHGSGSVRADGHVEELEVAVHGSGEVALAELVAREAEVAIFGSGRIDLGPVARLASSIHGSGEVGYRGTPVLESEVHGSGAVRPR